MSLKSSVFAALLIIGLSISSTAAASTPLEERTFFRPVRVGLCVGLAPDCPIGGLKAEFSSKYVGASFVATAGFGSSIKIYPGLALHKEAVSIRPFVHGSMGVSPVFPLMHGGGGGADIHLFKSKRLLLQPTASIVCAEDCFATGSMSVMAAF